MSYELSLRRAVIRPAVRTMAGDRAVGDRLNTGLAQYLANKQFIPGTGVVFIPGGQDEVGIRGGEYSYGKGSSVCGSGMSKAKAVSAGKMMAKRAMEDPEIKELVGSGFFQDFARGFMMPFKAIASVAKPILSLVPHPAAQAARVGMDLAGLGKASDTAQEVEEMTGDDEEVGDTGAVDVAVGGARAKPKPKRVMSDKMKKRGMLVKKLMSSEGLTLAQASRAIKERGLM